LVLSRQEEEIERREVLENDRLVREQLKQREQSGTYLSHTHPDEISGGGRYAVISPTVVTGAQPLPRYPAAGPHQSDPTGVEPPLGVSVDAMFVVPSADVLAAVEQLGAPAADSAPPSEREPPLADGVESGAGAPPFSKQTTNK
jgi:hypothetical protein